METSLAAPRHALTVDMAAEIERESMRIRCRQSIMSLPSMSVILLVFGAALWGEVENWQLASWLGLCFAMTVLRAAVCAWILPRVDAAEGGRLRNFERWLVATVLSNTIAMGAGVWWAALGGPIEAQYFVTLALCLYSVGALVNASSHAPSFVVGVVANLGQAIAFWAMQGIDGVKIAAPLAVIGLLLAGFARSNARTFAESVRMRFENTSLVAELSEEKKAVEHALAIAQEASESKSRFLAAASHDLRQPLHALRLQLGTMSLHAQSGAARDTVDRTVAMVESLDELFRNLLDLSRFDAGVLKPRLQPFPLGEMFSQLESEFRLLAEAKGLRFEARPLQVQVLSDFLLLERLLRNLLANAVRYTASGGVIFAAQRAAEGVVISVADTGPGIAKEHRKRIFEEFVQVREGSGGGVGLGLAIVRRIDALLGLGLRLVSDPPRGSEFSVRLPEAAG